MQDYFQLSSQERQERIAEIVGRFPEQEQTQRHGMLSSIVDNYEGYDRIVLDLFSKAVENHMGGFALINLQHFYDRTLSYCPVEYRCDRFPIDRFVQRLFQRLSTVINHYSAPNLEEVIAEESPANALQPNESADSESVKTPPLKKSA